LRRYVRDAGGRSDTPCAPIQIRAPGLTLRLSAGGRAPPRATRPHPPVRVLAESGRREHKFVYRACPAVESSCASCESISAVAIRKVLGGRGAEGLECDGCQAFSGAAGTSQLLAAGGWATSSDGTLHACPSCLAEDALFLPAMGMYQWITWDELEHLFRREPKIDRVRVGRWLTSAQRRGQIEGRRDEAGEEFRRAQQLPFVLQPR
jgi:hypothetical protein